MSTVETGLPQKPFIGHAQLNIHTEFVKPVIKPQPRNSRMSLPMVTDVCITSNSPTPVVAIDRNSIVQIVPTNTQPYAEGIVPQIFIHTTYSFRGLHQMGQQVEAMEAYHREMRIREPSFHIVLNKLKECIRDAKNQELLFCFEIQRAIPIADLKKVTGFYDHGSDFLFCANDQWQELRHPYSKDQVTRLGEKVVDTGKNLAGIVIEVVDNKGTIGPMFYHFIGEVHKTTPVIDLSRESGYYITRFNSEIPVRDQQAPEFLTSAEAISRKIVFHTIAEARTKGDPMYELENESRKRELDAKQNETKLREAMVERAREHQAELFAAQTERDKFKTDAAGQEIAHKNAMNQLAMQHENDKLELARRKEHYDRLAADRKDSSEVLKYGIGIVVGILGMVGAFWGRLTTSKPT